MTTYNRITNWSVVISMTRIFKFGEKCVLFLSGTCVIRLVWNDTSSNWSTLYYSSFLPNYDFSVVLLFTLIADFTRERGKLLTVCVLFKYNLQLSSTEKFTIISKSQNLSTIRIILKATPNLKIITMTRSENDFEMHVQVSGFSEQIIRGGPGLGSAFVLIISFHLTCSYSFSA